MKATYLYLLNDLERILSENDKDIKDTVNHLTFLLEQRDKLQKAIQDMKNDLKKAL